MINRNPTRASAFRPSVIFLIVVNLIPVIGVLLWGWSTFEIVALYWLENVVIGLVNILKMITCCPGEEAFRRSKIAARSGASTFPASKGFQHGIKFMLVPFFTVHYLGFCAGHGFFVFTLLSPGGMFANGPQQVDFPSVAEMFTSWPMLLAIGALLASHLFSFAFNYIGKGEYRRVTVDYLMFSPYGRIVVLHVAIIFGAWGIMALGNPVALLILLVILKLGLDIALHIRSHNRALEFQPPGATLAGSSAIE